MKTAEQHEQEMMERYRRSLQGATTEQKVSANLCPKHNDKPCLLCELTHQYFKTFTAKDHYFREKARNINRKFSYFSNVILPSNPSEVVIFEYGEVLHKKLFGYATDKNSEYNGYFHPVTGRNFYVKKTIPAGNKRQTTYDIEMRLQQTQLPDMAVLQRMNNLDNIIQILENKSVKIVRQTELPEGRIEMRMLPSWLGPMSKVFYISVPFHYMNKDEFEAVLSGKVNPYAEVGIKLPTTAKPESIIVASDPAGSGSSWANWPVGQKDEPTWQSPKLAQVGEPVVQKPPCFGTYNATSPLCNERCVKQGHTEECRAASAKSVTDQNEEARRIAARLYK